MGQALVIALLFTATLAPAAEPLPGTKPLTLEGDIAAHLLDGAHKFVDREIERSIQKNTELWKQEIRAEGFVSDARRRLKEVLGVVDERVFENDLSGLRTLGEFGFQERVPLSDGNIEAIPVSWPVVSSIHASGTYLKPRRLDTNMCVIVLEDRNLSLFSDPTTNPARVREGCGPERNVAFRLANAGCHVILPDLIYREPTNLWSTCWEAKQDKDLTDNELLYRQAFEVGRHPIGYDLQKTLSLVDWAVQRKFDKIAVIGYGEGGMQALYAGAIDTRIDAVVVGACYGTRNKTWTEPADHNIWGRISDFGDAELAALIAPRKLLIHSVENAGYIPDAGVAVFSKISAPGKLHVPTQQESANEWARLQAFDTGGAKSNPYANHLQSSGIARRLATICESWVADSLGFPPGLRDYDCQHDLNALDMQWNQFARRRADDGHDWALHTQNLLRDSEYHRILRGFSEARQSRDVKQWESITPVVKKVFYDEVIGRFEHDLKPFSAQTRQVYDTDKYRGYEVTLDVFDDVIAYGVLLVPKDIKPGEQRPVVVCQHGLEGRPQDTIEKDIPGERYYHQFAAKLAERGFVTFAPQNLYIFKDRFRELQRKLNPLKKTLFSLIVPQHEQICRWLKSQPFVDGSRIGFYGLSYGGKTAMRVPPLVDHYSCVICSGDFNDWIRKCTSIRDPFSYVGTGEYEIWEWNLANTFNYAEMAGLICPRPFMVERGHRDGVGLDSWVDYEYAKVRLLYVDLKIPERTEIEHFDGPHEINGVGSYKFLHKHLNWPEPK